MVRESCQMKIKEQSILYKTILWQKYLINMTEDHYGYLDNVISHTSVCTTKYLTGLNIELKNYPLYSLDLNLNKFCWFSTSEDKLCGQGLMRSKLCFEETSIEIVKELIIVCNVCINRSGRYFKK